MLTCEGQINKLNFVTRASQGQGPAQLHAPAGGAAAAALEGGALVGPSAPTSTSTRWALVAMLGTVGG
jgi:hypothetical protein